MPRGCLRTRYGMESDLPSRITSDFNPLAALSFDTLVPYFLAMPESVSPLFTVCFLPDDFFFAEEPDDDFFEEPLFLEEDETFVALPILVRAFAE